jgi:NAD(P)-dependent dehydrogenase (short-subunit alcohol dehydrogenase family)
MPWTAADVPDQDDRVVVITGSNSGIGQRAAATLAARGATVVLACRNQDKAEAAADEIRREASGGHVEVAVLDLASLESIHSFAADLHHERIDVLINNAGVMASPHRTTADGFELQLGTNHLGHFALTGLLANRLGGADPRVVTISSTAHKIGRVDFEDLQGERSYQRWRAYGQSKLANLLFAFELDRRLRAVGSTIRSVAAHPGYSATNLQFAATPSRIEKIGSTVLNRVYAQSADRGAEPTLFAATADVPSGSFVGPDGFQEMRGHPTLVRATKAANDPDAARRLWEISEELTGVRFELTESPAGLPR